MSPPESPLDPRPETGPEGEPAGLRAQLGATKASVLRLLRAHLDLARAELGEILDEAKRLALLLGIAFGALTLLGLLVPIGLALFLGEWLFGSLGWGLLHATLLLIAVALVASLAALGLSGGRLKRDLALAVVIGLVTGVLFGLDLSNAAWARLGESLGLATDPGVRPLVVGTVALALVGAVTGLVLGARAGGGNSTGAGLLGGALLGALLGAFSAITFGGQAGAAVGVGIALVAWPLLSGLGLARIGIDGEAMKARFWPAATIETTKETIEWVRAQTPLGPKS